MRFTHFALRLSENRIVLLLLFFFILSSLFACQRPLYIIGEYDVTQVEKNKIPPVIEPVTSPLIKEIVPRMEYAIQAGAFSRLGNAVRFTESLQKLGLEPYYFKDDLAFRDVILKTLSF